MISLHHAHLMASDIDATIAFWRDYFSAEVVFDDEFAGARNVFMRVGRCCAALPGLHARITRDHLATDASTTYHMPPSATVIASPFTPPAASLHRNAITCATSLGSRTRFWG